MIIPVQFGLNCMKKGTSAIHGTTFFFYKKGHGAAPFYFSLYKTLG
jgi:hypothetical protein